VTLVGGVGRLSNLYARTTASRSVVALLTANAIPLVGVLFFDWSLWTILVLYWLENGIVGLWNLPRILLAEGTTPASGLTSHLTFKVLGNTVNPFDRVATALFFAIHYGIFWTVHGVFVFTLPLFAGFSSAFSSAFSEPQFIQLPDGTFGVLDQVSHSAFGEIAWSSVAIGAVAMVISHGASFFLNYIGQDEYKRATPLGQMVAPYGRVVVLHVTILLGAFAIAFLGAPIVLLVILVILKSALDLRLHIAERIRMAALPDVPPQPPRPSVDTGPTPPQSKSD
jgi:hypothetical protein